MDYYGLPTCRIENESIALEVLAQAGPRIVRLMRRDANENMLAEAPDISIPSPYGPFKMYGGHRLWHAPEVRQRTYYPDDSGVALESFPGGLYICGPVEPPTGIRKEIHISLEGDQPLVKLTHHLKNTGLWPVELAPWAITMLPLGGKIILPQPNGPGKNELLPNRTLALWPYTRLNDPRLELGDEYIYLHAQANKNPIKIGYRNIDGWAAYEHNGVLFVKHFSPAQDAKYPDEGCNVETYCWDRFIELETLGPLVSLEPGESVEHTEVWEIADPESWSASPTRV